MRNGLHLGCSTLWNTYEDNAITHTMWVTGVILGPFNCIEKDNYAESTAPEVTGWQKTQRAYTERSNKNRECIATRLARMPCALSMKDGYMVNWIAMIKVMPMHAESLPFSTSNPRNDQKAKYHISNC